MARKPVFKANDKAKKLAKTIDKLVQGYLKRIGDPSYKPTIVEFMKLIELEQTLTPEKARSTHLTVGWCDRVIVPDDCD